MVREKDEDRGEISLRAIFVFVAIIAFVAAPILKYADIVWAITAAGIGRIGIQLMIIDRKRTGPGTLGSIILTGSLIWGASLLFDAAQVHHENQKRCLPIETDMLSPRPTRSNGADLFQALGCEPQPIAVNAALKARSSLRR